MLAIFYTMGFTESTMKRIIIIMARLFVFEACNNAKNKVAYKEPPLHSNPRKKAKKIKSYLEKLKEMGVEVEIKQAV